MKIFKTVSHDFSIPGIFVQLVQFMMIEWQERKHKVIEECYRERD